LLSVICYWLIISADSLFSEMLPITNND
jgi:hypothetical protein